MTEPLTTQSQDEYYKDLLTRVDSTIAQTNKVTFSGAYEDPYAAPEPSLFRVILSEHSVLGVCWHQDLENRFTRPLKIYFLVLSILFTLFLGMKLKTATGFGDWVAITILLNMLHWGQRFLFFKFQNSLILWPFTAAVAVMFFTFYDLYSFGAVGGKRVKHAFGIGLAVYLFGFMLPEAIILGYRHRRQQANARRGLPTEEVRSSGDFEEYSTL